jgi:hypothetical protein
MQYAIIDSDQSWLPESRYGIDRDCSKYFWAIYNYYIIHGIPSRTKLIKALKDYIRNRNGMLI